MTTTTQYMDLILPTPSETIGPTYAILEVAAFETIDAHDHTTGKGTAVPTAGININADLTLNNYALTDAKYYTFTAQGSTPSPILSLYVNNSNDLYYKNGSGTAVQITSGSAVASSGSGVITYSAVTTTPYAVSTGDAQKVLGVNTSTAKTLNLPAASNVMFIQIKDITGTASSNNITINPNGSDTIEGLSSFVMNEDYSARSLMSDGSSKWYIL